MNLVYSNCELLKVDELEHGKQYELVHDGITNEHLKRSWEKQFPIQRYNSVHNGMEFIGKVGEGWIAELWGDSLFEEI